MELVIYPNEVLRSECAEVEAEEVEELVEGMLRLLADLGGLGLAAPQVGVSKRVCLVGASPTGPWRVLLNPRIDYRGGATKTRSEGCLSLPGVTVQVPRPNKVFIKYQDENGKRTGAMFRGLLARAACHEIDHLDGVLITDYS